MLFRPWTGNTDTPLIKNGTVEAGVELETQIANVQKEIDKMTPNMKAMEK